MACSCITTFAGHVLVGDPWCAEHSECDQFQQLLGILNRAGRVVFLSHAVRHLVDHTDPLSSPWYAADTDAIFILQMAMDGPEPYIPAPRILLSEGEA